MPAWSGWSPPTQRRLSTCTVSDLRSVARRRLPRFAFDYLDGAAGEELTDADNRHALARLKFKPRVMTDVSRVDASVIVLGERLSLPCVIGPTGMNGVYWPRAEEHLAAAASRAGVPFALSTASTSLIEDVRAASAGPLWMQLYVQQDRRISEDIMRRARDAGFKVLVLTVDVPVTGHRERDRRNGLSLPIRITPSLLGDVFLRPAWAWRMAMHGRPALVNMVARQGAAGFGSAAIGAPAIPAIDPSVVWSDLAWLRKHWHGPIVLKGIQCVEDARLAVAHGVDGIVVSNHGGRQLDGVPATATLLEAIVQAVGGTTEVLVDGGFRTGADIARALALGARAVLLGRAPLYGLGAAGPAGVVHVMRLLQAQFETTLRLLGCTSAASLGRRHLVEG
ncbi:alpha-hydroxy acid oxidase [Variovorax sp. PBL-E5]|uniref:alpha-hydroxy acid oxidase n=1 Tax=Variovorax sp. PBL-E5 TaxID=434014 RepID=UPI001317265A|nr:alpha-hydroxy acid oxidase [Variovorax sp. PBL-E5]VTU39993.1 (S)-mandelate dehydrogenase [Variovorax sp. PBL-E5]